MDVSLPVPSFQIQCHQRPCEGKKLLEQNINGSTWLEENLLGLNGVAWDVEWVAHYISERVVQFSEHLRMKFKGTRYTR